MIQQNACKNAQTYVSEHQFDWIDYLPFVTMAYRSVERQTTECTPNYLMFGREVQTPLDVMFEMPASEKSILANRWACDLKLKMEAAHIIVRKNTSEVM